MTDILAREAAEIEELEKDDAPEQKASDPSLKPNTKTGQADEPQADSDEADADGEQGARKVTVKALREERDAAYRARQEMEARYAHDMARLNERLAIIAQQSTQRQAEAQRSAEIPDINTDPIGHFQAKQEMLERQLAEARQYQQRQMQMTEQQGHLQKIGAEVSRLEQEFTKSTPDYPQAQQHLFTTWANEAQVLGVSAEEAIKFYSMQIVQRAAQLNKNPAQVAYELAKERGYGRDQARPVAQPASPKGPSLDTIQKGLAVSKSTSAAPGKAAQPGAPTIEALLAMDDDEFAKNYGSRDAQSWSRDVERIMGLR